MHGTVFPPIEGHEVISIHLFILFLFGIVMVLVIANRLYPKIFTTFFVNGCMTISAIILIWELTPLFGIIRPAILPPPSRVFSMIVYLWDIGFLQWQVFATLYRLFISFVLAFVCGVTLGIIVGYFSNAFAFIEAFTTPVRVVPAPAWLSVSILWFGIGDESAIFIIWLGCFFPIFLSTMAGVAKVEPVHVESVQTAGGSTFDVLFRVVLPVSYHHIITGSRIGLGIGWISVVTAELISPGSGGGIGWMIMDARVLLDITTVTAGIVIIGVLAAPTDLALKKMESLVQGWG